MPVTHRKHTYRDFRFLVEIDGVVQAGFSEATIPDSTSNAIEHREGNGAPSARKMPRLTKHGALTLKRGIIDSVELYNWCKLMEQGKMEKGKKQPSRNQTKHCQQVLNISSHENSELR